MRVLSSQHCSAHSQVCLYAIQAVVDDLGVQDVDEFEAELAALNGTKSA